MKTKHLVAVLLGLASLALFAADASAMYNPALGCWMQRDPGPGGMMPASPRVGGGPAVGGGFLPREADARAQYRDGMHLYQYVRSNPISRVDPSGLISLDGAVMAAIINRPAGVDDNYTPGLMICLLWKESSFDAQAGNTGSSAKGIAQLLEGTADDIKDRVGPKVFGIPKDPFYTLAAGERLKDHRLEVDPSVYAAYLYLEDRRRAKGGKWENGVTAYGPNGDKVIECTKCCAIMKLKDDFTVKNPEEVWKCLHAIHK